ncbi:MAG: DEAD/DEAH box helicase [Acidimicrobiales bacterium]|jgi:ATP-dependent RNA helicase HelY
MKAPSAGVASREQFVAEHPYPLDRFQLDAIELLDDGQSVLVSAPTGSGKTVVAEYAVHLALQEGAKVFYTTPIKALSNQKYGDFRRKYGADRVGLLTGDNSINGQAPIVVMTTEVLRNMIHAEPGRLADLRYVVLDEVHFLQDPYRGGVWEEVILGAPSNVTLVCLSATVANADQLAAWISEVRGTTGVVIESHRPVELKNLFVVGDRSSEHIQLLPTFVDGRPNPEAVRLDGLMARAGTGRRGAGRAGPGGAGTPGAAGVRSRPARPQLYRPRRVEVVDRLAAERLLPAIYFVFSRAGCDESVRHCLVDGLRLTTPEEQRRIRAIVESYVDPLTDDDLAVLGYPVYAAGLEAGVAAHHAGMVPPFREAVEACFAEALVKVVFATETLALGINMPARSVVIEEVTKFGGRGHQELTPGEYTQLTGRAGRRGIDDIGYAAVVCSPFHSFGDVARIAGGRPRALSSSFRPTYNLAVNLVRRHSREAAYTLVSSSFAQFLTDEDLVGELDSVLGVLERRGYLEGWRITEAGGRLAGLYHEADLLVAESLEAGHLDGLDPASLAAVTSGLCYEARREREAPLPAPNAKVARRLEAIEQLSEALSEEEKSAHLPVTRGVDTGFAALIYEWARGRDLRQVLQPGGGPGRRGRKAAPLMSGGDFVRNVKQVIDLLRQVAMVAARPETSKSARAGAERLLRDVVAASSVVTIPVEHGTIRAGGQPAP